MKHIFLVHSPITYLSAVSVIKKLGVANQNAIIIFFDFKKILQPEIYIAVSVDEYYNNQPVFKKLINYFTQFNLIKRFDKLVAKTIQQNKFIAYIPVLTFAAKALITNTNCVSFNFIEEGLANYYKEETLNSLTAINSKDKWRSSIVENPKLILKELYSVLRGYNFRLQGLPFSYTCYNAVNNVSYYGLSEDSFPLIEKNKKVIISFHHNNFEGIKQTYSTDISNSFIWIGDGSVQQYGFDKTIYLQAIEDGFIKKILLNNKQKVFLKFHRSESASLQKEVIQLLEKNNITFQVIPDNTIMELLLFNAQNVTLTGIYSSLLYYAVILGHRSFSVYNFVENEYKKALENRDFSFYWNKVKLIDTKEVNINPILY